MSQSPFATPAAPGEGITWPDLVGSLVLVKVVGVEPAIETVNGVTDAVRATVTILDGPKSGEVNEDALIFPRVLKGQLKSRIGELVLGRVTQGVAKPGKNAPWMLNPATDADIAMAENYMRQKATPQVSSVQSQPPF